MMHTSDIPWLNADSLRVSARVETIESANTTSITNELTRRPSTARASCQRARRSRSDWQCGSTPWHKSGGGVSCPRNETSTAGAAWTKRGSAGEKEPLPPKTARVDSPGGACGGAGGAARRARAMRRRAARPPRGPSPRCAGSSSCQGTAARSRRAGPSVGRTRARGRDMAPSSISQGRITPNNAVSGAARDARGAKRTPTSR